MQRVSRNSNPGRANGMSRPEKSVDQSINLRARLDINLAQEIELEQRSPRGTSSRRWRRVLPAILIIVIPIFSLGGWRMWQARRYARALALVNAQMAAGQNGLASRNLIALLDWKPDSDEAMYLLGVCERARGRAEPALESWARVPPDSPFWAPAIHGCRELKVERGLLADAEQLIKLAQQTAPEKSFLLNDLFVPIYCFQGRIEDASRLIEDEWNHLNRNGEGATEMAIKAVQLHMVVKRSIADPGPTRDYLAKASRVAPKDDRVWLGRAELAIRDGSFDLAAGLLDDCLKRRPDDVPVWRAKLSHALATNQLAMVRQALEHLPADQSTPAQTHKLTAWIAGHQDDLETEQRELERLVQADPADVSALTRLAELADKTGRVERREELRRQKNEIEQLRARYEQLYQRNQPFRDALEMARLATKLGLGFEAKAFLTVVVAENPGRTDLRDELERLNRPTNADATPGSTLAKLVDRELASR
jgi:tetratricopeptide (TPR) repeat protein